MELLVKIDKSNKSNKSHFNLKIPWIEKYRPNNIEEVLFDDFMKNKIFSLIKKDIPNLIFTGEPGTGKTSTILCLVKRIYTDKEYEENILELNASDDRGLNIINSTIIPFCKKKSYNYKNKIIILDEADSITTKAQILLATLISEYSKNTRFVFICNESNKIIEAVQSNCIIINFPNISKSNIKRKIIDICKNEKIEYTKEAIDDLIFVSDNNIRNIINNLECLYNCYGKLESDDIFTIIDKPKPFYTNKILTNCINGDINIAYETLYHLYNLGYGVNDILQSLMKYLLENDYHIEKNIKMKIFEILSLCYIRVNDGIDSLLQLVGSLSKINIYIKNQQI